MQSFQLWISNCHGTLLTRTLCDSIYKNNQLSDIAVSDTQISAFLLSMNHSPHSLKRVSITLAWQNENKGTPNDL